MNDKEKAVEILNNIGYDCEYDKENDDIKIWNQLSRHFILFYHNTNHKGEKSELFNLNIGTMNLNFEEQKKEVKKLQSVLDALDKINEFEGLKVH